MCNNKCADVMIYRAYRFYMVSPVSIPNLSLCVDTPCLSSEFSSTVLFAIYFRQIFNSISFYPHTLYFRHNSFLLHSQSIHLIFTVGFCVFVFHKSFRIKTRQQSSFAFCVRYICIKPHYYHIYSAWYTNSNPNSLFIE